MSNDIIIAVVVFIIIGIVSVFAGVKKLYGLKRQSSEWYKESYITAGITSFIIALFFLLIGYHDMLPSNATIARLVVFGIAGVVLFLGAISCIAMIRYYPFAKARKEGK